MIDGTDVIDEEEFALLKNVKDKKKKYSTHYDEYTNLRGEVTYLKGV